MTKIFLTINIDDQFKFVEVVKFNKNLEGLIYTDFVFTALQDSQVQYEDFDCFLNVHGARMEEEIFMNFMNQYLNYPCCCASLLLRVKKKSVLNLDTLHSKNINQINDSELLNIIIDSPKDLGAPLKRTNAAIGPNLIVTSDSLKESFIKKAGGPTIFSDFEKKGFLTDLNRRKIVSFLGTYIQEMFGFKPSKDEQLASAEACVKLFPSLELDILFNKSNTGFLQIKLKNDRVKKRKLEKEFDAIEQCEITNELVDEEEIKKDLDILKTLNLPEEILLAKQKLKSTETFRRKEVLAENYDIFDSCSYFYICPELITFDFNLKYDNKPHLTIEWPSYQERIFTVVKNSGKQILYTETERKNDWDIPVLSFINLIRLLPPSAAGRTKFTRLTDEQAVERLIVFKNSELTRKELLEGCNESAPYIIASGASKADIKEYFIVLDGNLMLLPSISNFIEALDLVFKIHFLFNIQYDNNLRLFFIFLQKYIYKIESKNTPITVVELYSKISKLN